VKLTVWICVTHLTPVFWVHRIVVWRSIVGCSPGPSPLEKGSWEGETPVLVWELCAMAHAFNESCWLGFQHKFCGKCHIKLNIGGRPIAHKYREGKMQRTLKRELKSTWNCWKGSEGNQCRSVVILPLLLADGALWQYVDQHQLYLGPNGWLVDSPFRGASASHFWSERGWGQSFCARDADEMVFFTPSWNTDQGV
jgi:hypothetical protein